LWKYAIKVDYNATYCVDDIYVEGSSIVTNNDWDFLTLKYSCGTCINCQRPGGERMMSNNHPERSVSGFYPNPFSTTAELQLDPSVQITDAVLSIHDVTGRLITSIPNISSTTVVVERGILQSGLYFYKLTENGNMISNGKFIISD